MSYHEVFRDRDMRSFITHEALKEARNTRQSRKFIKDLKGPKSLVGINKSETFGCGFTQTLRPFESL